MMSRDEMKAYALKICVPLMERNIRRDMQGVHAYKPDQVGFVPADLENLCRPFWGIAPLIAEGEEIYLHVGDKTITAAEYVQDFLKKGLSHGTEKSWDEYKQYYSPYAYENQNITELAGLMIGIFFARKNLWDTMTEHEQVQIAREIYEMAEAAFDNSWPNNHYWFPLFAITVLKRLGFAYDRTDEMLDKGLEFLDSLYIGDGWYKDGEFGRFDYYEAWSLHLYPLLWTLIADESFHNYAKYKRKYIERTNAFLTFYTHWFDSNGANVPFGRSLSYRFAACALFPTAVLAGCDIAPELAGRITAMNIDFFREHVHTEDSDILPEGYLYRTTNVIEGYTSDGGAYWCCKAFMALLIEENHPFWNAGEALLPAEKGDFLVAPAHKDIHMLFEGSRGIVTLYNNTAQYYINSQMTHPFGDIKCWYSKFVYNSVCGFGCSVPDKVAADSMISLVTPDHSMTSHRLGYRDMGYRDGVLHSIHTPFNNDMESTIETFVIPMGGMHVRVHKVTLSRPYYVKEGGFSLGRWDDYHPVSMEAANRHSGYCRVENHAYVSELKAVCSENATIKCSVGDVQASCHLYAPLADYPMYITEEPLEAGEYLFAAAFRIAPIIAKDGDQITARRLPDIFIQGSKVTVMVEDRVFFEKTLYEKFAWTEQRYRLVDEHEREGVS